MSGRRRAAWLAGFTIAVSAWSADARAQQILKDNEWHYAVVPYVWIVGLDGDVGVRRLTSSVDLKPWEVYKSLQFGVMGAVEARRNQYMLALDGIYAKLGDAKALAIRGDTGGLDLTEHLTILQPAGGYTIGDSTWSVDFLLGMRYWNLSTSLDVNFPRLSNERSGTKQWLDATGGFRFHWMPIERFRVVAAGDGGGGGSKDTWQAYGSLGYDVSTRWSASLAYRVLAVNYDRDNFLFDTRLKGFVVGATYRTW